MSQSDSSQELSQKDNYASPSKKSRLCWNYWEKPAKSLGEKLCLRDLKYGE